MPTIVILACGLRGSSGLAPIPVQVCTIAPGRRWIASCLDRRALLTRRVGDRQIVVKVLKDGFEYESRRYGSLSAIAREVTGTRWNGLLFFGLTERRNA